MESTYCIYIHKNKINNKVYVGQTCQSPESRWKNGEGYKGCPQFYAAIQKYGWDNFEHIILENNLTLEEANEKEAYYIRLYDSYKNGYNATLGGKNAPKTEEHKLKLSESNVGKHPHQGELNPMYGKHMSEEAKQKSRLKQKGVLKVKCIETGEIFTSTVEAAKAYNLKSHTNIVDCIHGKKKSAGKHKVTGEKLHWCYI